MRLVFRQNLVPEKGRFAVKRKRFSSGTDRGRTEAGRGGSTGGRTDPPGWNQRADPVPMEETVQGARDRPAPAVQAAAGRERAIEAVGGGADVGQDDAAGC